MPIPRALAVDRVAYAESPLATLVSADRFCAPAELVVDLEACQLREAFVQEREHLANTLDDLLRSLLKHKPFGWADSTEAALATDQFERIVWPEFLNKYRARVRAFRRRGPPIKVKRESAADAVAPAPKDDKGWADSVGKPLSIPSSSSNNGGGKSRRKVTKVDTSTRQPFTVHAGEVCLQWFVDHIHDPYPSDPEKEVIARTARVAYDQISSWFINARMRRWKKLLEGVQDGSIKQSRGTARSVAALDAAVEFEAAASNSAKKKNKKSAPRKKATKLKREEEVEEEEEEEEEEEDSPSDPAPTAPRRSSGRQTKVTARMRDQDIVVKKEPGLEEDTHSDEEEEAEGDHEAAVGHTDHVRLLRAYGKYQDQAEDSLDEDEELDQEGDEESQLAADGEEVAASAGVSTLALGDSVVPDPNGTSNLMFNSVFSPANTVFLAPFHLSSSAMMDHVGPLIASMPIGGGGGGLSDSALAAGSPMHTSPYHATSSRMFIMPRQRADESMNQNTGGGGYGGGEMMRLSNSGPVPIGGLGASLVGGFTNYSSMTPMPLQFSAVHASGSNLWLGGVGGGGGGAPTDSIGFGGARSDSLSMSISTTTPLIGSGASIPFGFQFSLDQAGATQARSHIGGHDGFAVFNSPPTVGRTVAASAAATVPSGSPFTVSPVAIATGGFQAPRPLYQ